MPQETYTGIDVIHSEHSSGLQTSDTNVKSGQETSSVIEKSMVDTKTSNSSDSGTKEKGEMDIDFTPSTAVTSKMHKTSVDTCENFKNLPANKTIPTIDTAKETPSAPPVFKTFTKAIPDTTIVTSEFTQGDNTVKKIYDNETHTPKLVVADSDESSTLHPHSSEPDVINSKEIATSSQHESRPVKNRIQETSTTKPSDKLHISIDDSDSTQTCNSNKQTDITDTNIVQIPVMTEEISSSGPNLVQPHIGIPEQVPTQTCDTVKAQAVSEDKFSVAIPNAAQTSTSSVEPTSKETSSLETPLTTVAKPHTIQQYTDTELKSFSGPDVMQTTDVVFQTSVPQANSVNTSKLSSSPSTLKPHHVETLGPLTTQPINEPTIQTTEDISLQPNIPADKTYKITPDTVQSSTPVSVDISDNSLPLTTSKLLEVNNSQLPMIIPSQQESLVEGGVVQVATPPVSCVHTKEERVLTVVDPASPQVLDIERESCQTFSLSPQKFSVRNLTSENADASVPSSSHETVPQEQKSLGGIEIESQREIFPLKVDSEEVEPHPLQSNIPVNSLPSDLPATSQIPVSNVQNFQVGQSLLTQANVHETNTYQTSSSLILEEFPNDGTKSVTKLSTNLSSEVFSTAATSTLSTSSDSLCAINSKISSKMPPSQEIISFPPQKSPTDAGAVQVPKVSASSSNSSQIATSILESITQDEKSISEAAVLPSITSQECAIDLPSESVVDPSSQISLSTGNLTSLRASTVPSSNSALGSTASVTITPSSQIPSLEVATSQVAATFLSQPSLPSVANTSQHPNTQKISDHSAMTISGESTTSQVSSVISHPNLKGKVPDSQVLSSQILDETSHDIPSQMSVQQHSVLSSDIHHISEATSLTEDLSSQNCIPSSSANDLLAHRTLTDTNSFQTTQALPSQISYKTAVAPGTNTSTETQGVEVNIEEPTLSLTQQSSHPLASVSQTISSLPPTESSFNRVTDKECIPSETQSQYISGNQNTYLTSQVQKHDSKELPSENKTLNASGAEIPTVGQESHFAYQRTGVQIEVTQDRSIPKPINFTPTKVEEGLQKEFPSNADKTQTSESIRPQKSKETPQKNEQHYLEDAEGDSRNVAVSKNSTMQKKEIDVPSKSATEYQNSDSSKNSSKKGKLLGEELSGGYAHEAREHLSGDDSEDISVAEDALLAMQIHSEVLSSSQDNQLSQENIIYRSYEKDTANDSPVQEVDPENLSQRHANVVVTQNTSISSRENKPSVASDHYSVISEADSKSNTAGDLQINLPEITVNREDTNQCDSSASLKDSAKPLSQTSTTAQLHQVPLVQKFSKSLLDATDTTKPSEAKPDIGRKTLPQIKEAFKLPSKSLAKGKSSGEGSSGPLSPALPAGSPFHMQSTQADSKTEAGYKKTVRQISNVEDSSVDDMNSGRPAALLQISESQTQEFAGRKSQSSIDSCEDIKSKSEMLTVSHAKGPSTSISSPSCTAKTKREFFSKKSKTTESKKFDTVHQFQHVEQIKKENEAIKGGSSLDKSIFAPDLGRKGISIKDESQNSSHTFSSPSTKRNTPDTLQPFMESQSKEPGRQDLQESLKRSNKENYNCEEAMTKEAQYERTQDLSLSGNRKAITSIETSGGANVEVTVSDFSESSTVEHPNNLTLSQHTEDDTEMRLSQLSPRSKEREKRRIEKLTSASWQGTFVMEHESSQDDWGASDESITFIFMTPGEEEKSMSTKDNYGTSACSNYRSSTDLSHVGLTLGAPGNAQYVHSYDLYKTNCRRLIRTTSLDSISSALQKLRVAKLKAEMQRTCSLEDMTQEMAAILERGRMFTSTESDIGASDAELAVLDDNGSKSFPEDKNNRIVSYKNKEMGSTQRASDSSSGTLKKQGSDHSSAEDDVFVRSPSPAITYGQASWGDWKNMILGHTSSPIRRMSGETSKSSPQLHQRISAENLNKKSVSWTDLQGCGALEVEVPELDEVKGRSSRPTLQVKSIMKKPSLAPIAPTPPPPTTPPPSPPKYKSKTNLNQGECNSPSTDDDMPLPKSNLKEMFSLQLPPHIKDRAFRSESSSSGYQRTHTSYGSPPIRDIGYAGKSNIRMVGYTQLSGRTPSPITVNIQKQYGSADNQNMQPSSSYEDHMAHNTRKSAMAFRKKQNEFSSYGTRKLDPYSYKHPERLSSSSSHYSASESYANISSDTSSHGSSPVSDSTTFEALDSDTIQKNSSSIAMPRFLKKGSQIPSALATSTPTDAEFPVPSPLGIASAPTTPGDISKQGRNYNMPRYRSEGDLTKRNEAGLPGTWATLSRVMEEAGTILKTLSETSLVLHHQMASPDQRASLPPVLEENSSNFYMSDPKRVSSVAVQTSKSHKARMNTRSSIAHTSFDSSSDTENIDSYSRKSYTPSKTLPHKISYKRYETSSTGSREMPVLRELNRLRKERERMNSAMSQYDSSTLHIPPSRSRGIHMGSSSELDSPISSLVTSLQNVTYGSSHQDRESVGGTYSHHNLSATSQRYLAMYQRRLQDSCHQLEERLRLSAKKRKLRSRLLSNSHSHFHTDPAKMALHASLDFAKKPFCGRPEDASSPSYLSTASLPTIGPPSPAHTKRDISPCCCISPTHQSYHSHSHSHSHLCSPVGTCSAHTHWVSCHGSPAPDLSYTPHCMTARVRQSSQQCRDQLLNLRKQLVSTSGLASSSSSLGDSSPPGRGNSYRLRGMGSIFDTPYQRDQAASLSSLPISSNHRTWKRSNLTGSAISVASESEADRLKWPRHRFDSDSDSGAGWSSSGTSLRHTYR